MRVSMQAFRPTLANGYRQARLPRGACVRACPRSVRPGRVQDDAAQVPALERGILEGEEVVVEGAEGAVGPVLQAVVEGIDDGVLEVVRAWPGGGDRLAFLVGKLVVRATGHVHARGDMQQRGLRMHELRNAGS